MTLTYVLLHGRYAVLQELVDAVRHQLDGAPATWAEGYCYRAPDLTGYAFWNQLTTEERRLTGSVISHMVKLGELPLAKVEKRSVGEANRYVATATANPNNFGSL